MVWYSDHRVAFLMYVPASLAGLLAVQVRVLAHNCVHTILWADTQSVYFVKRQEHGNFGDSSDISWFIYV